MSRTDTRGAAGSTVLHDYYEALDADDTAWIVDAATGAGITYEDDETLLGRYGICVEYDSEWSVERSAEAIYEYIRGRGEPVTMSRTAVSLGTASPALGESGDEALAGAWWWCGDEGEGRITDEADVEIAAEYLYAAAYEN